jgi:hypothetical protein
MSERFASFPIDEDAATAARLTREELPLVALPPATVKGKEQSLELFRVDWSRA